MEVQFEAGSSIELFAWVLRSEGFTDVRGIWTQLVFVETSAEERVLGSVFPCCSGSLLSRPRI